MRVWPSRLKSNGPEEPDTRGGHVCSGGAQNTSAQGTVIPATFLRVEVAR
jgi:hypothetical protein